MALNTLKAAAAAAAAVLALTGVASAGTSSFIMVSGVDHPGINVSLTVQNSSTPGFAYDFIVNNNSSVGSVTGVYFEKGWNAKLWGAGLSAGPADLDPASLSPSISGWAGSKVSHTVGKEKKNYWIGRGYRTVKIDRVGDGILPGQSQVFSFNTDSTSVPLSNIEEILGQDSFGVAIRVQGLLQDDQAAGWGLVEPISIPQPGQDPGQDGPGQDITGVPSPTAALSGLAMLGFAGMRRRRRD